MNNVFNKMQMFKSSENCDKYSKSVSYETLVGGTTTTGTDIKQTRRLIKGSADKPLSAVGTFSAFYNTSKVVEKLLHCHPERSEESIKNNIKYWILRFAPAPLRMTMSVLAFILSFNLSTAWAINCPQGTQGSDNASDSNYCGANCCWGIDSNNVLTITPALDSDNNPYTNVIMRDFDYVNPGTDVSQGYDNIYSSKAPWARRGVTSVVVEEGISNISYCAFRGENLITSINIPDSVISIGAAAFYNAKSLSDIYMPGVTSIDEGAFMYATSLQSVDMPKISSIGEKAFGGDTALKYVGYDNEPTVGAKAFFANLDFGPTLPLMSLCDDSSGYIICTTCISSQVYQPGTGCSSTCGTGYTASNGLCKKNQAQSTPSNAGNQGGTSEGTQGSGQATSAADCKNNGQYWQEGECVSSCGASFKLNDGWCDRQRYTPAEAAAILNDDDNTITITFKK